MKGYPVRLPEQAGVGRCLDRSGEHTQREQQGNNALRNHPRGEHQSIIPLDESGIDPESKSAINQFRALTGKKVAYKILNFDKDAGMFIASRKQAKEQMAEITLRKIDEGYRIYCVVRDVEPGHIIGDIGGIDVHIPVFELTYGWVDDLRERYETGDIIEVQVMSINRETLEVSVSAKPLLNTPFPDCAERYKKSGEYVGKVSGVQEYGIFVNLEEGVDALARHLKFQNVQKGDQVLVSIRKRNASHPGSSGFFSFS